ncbi:MAG: DNA-3-methyladenine glycosylase 2 family protein [Saprospiraceae bacterium]|jgi:DNA-3-methyladenine glycosylase II|nr:DNA-3-methyladenine glycosylase 2 family protein [Saprospiraceae bacterium]
MQAKITQHLSKDPILKPLVDVIPFRELASNSQGVYLDLLGSIISQQLSVKVAAVIERRFLALFPDEMPHPHLLIKMDIPTLRSAGLSQQKAAYLQNVATFFQKENLLEKDWVGVDNDEIIRYLTQIKGVGKWTVEMILMFSLSRPDVLPLDDLGIRQGIANLYGVTETGKPMLQRMADIAAAWQPYRSYACLYLWRHKDGV